MNREISPKKAPAAAHVRAALLLDCYSALLTERQRTVMALHYEDDLSFAEIAESMGITRQGAQELASRAMQKLEEAEQRLHMAERADRMQARLAMISKEAERLPANEIKAALLRLADSTDEELFGSEYHGI